MASITYYEENVHMVFLSFSDFVTDFDFSPFDDYLLATCSQDFTVMVFSNWFSEKLQQIAQIKCNTVQYVTDCLMYILRCYDQNHVTLNVM